MPEIVGLAICKNEDLWIHHAVSNVLGFVDRLTVIDNDSTDGTMDILRGFGSAITVEHVHGLDGLRSVHGKFIEPLAGKDIWMFAVDGDEVFDPVGLSTMRTLLKAGEFNRWWHLRGRFFHATEMDIAKRTAKGHHTRMYKHPFTGKVNSAYTDYDWEDCPLRCMHMRHLRRSTQELEATAGCRLGMSDQLGRGSRADRGGRDDRSYRLKYRKGEIAQIGTVPFFGNSFMPSASPNV